jgi:hypothetical protein
MSDGSTSDIEQNAGRCDVCGNPIDMSSGDRLVLSEFGIQDEGLKQEHELTDQDAIDAVADALEREAESGKGYELAKVIREGGEMRAHRDCLDETNYTVLETELGCSVDPGTDQNDHHPDAGGGSR